MLGSSGGKLTSACLPVGAVSSIRRFPVTGGGEPGVCSWDGFRVATRRCSRRAARTEYSPRLCVLEVSSMEERELISIDKDRE